MSNALLTSVCNIILIILLRCNLLQIFVLYQVILGTPQVAIRGPEDLELLYYRPALLRYYEQPLPLPFTYREVLTQAWRRAPYTIRGNAVQIIAFGFSLDRIPAEYAPLPFQPRLFYKTNFLLRLILPFLVLNTDIFNCLVTPRYLRSWYFRI